MFTDPVSSPTEFATSTRFVGRRQELGAMRSALAEALSGHGRLVMLAGEPGIGKTRTSQELSAYAGSKGVQVLWGWCYEESGAPPYWPWVQLLRTYIRQQDPEQLRSQMGAGAPDIAEIIPEVREKLLDLQPSPALEPDQARFRLFDSVTTFLKNASQSQPLMLVLDDLHWADRPSLLLLQFLGRHLEGSRLLVVGCYRDVEVSTRHPLSDTMAQASKEPGFRRLVLHGVGKEDAARFIEQEAGMTAPPQVVETIYGLTDGNPFFLIEVAKLLAERGELGKEDIGKLEDIKVPVGVREAVGQRLNRRSTTCNQMLTIASVVGREFSLELMAHLIDDISEEDILGALDEALAGGMIEGSPQLAGSYRFTHALIQNTLASELSAARRARLHAHIGEALEELYGAEANAGILAYHFAQALPVVGPVKLVRYSLLAGELALDAYAPEEALAHFERALNAKEGLPMDEETAAILFRLGRAQAAVLPRDRRREAMDNLNRAFDYYVQAEDFSSAVEVAEFPLSTTIGISEGAAELVSRALPLVASDSPAAGRLQVRNGWVLGRMKDDYDGALIAFNQACNIASKHKEIDLEMDALAASAEIDVFHLHCQESVQKSLRVIELAKRSNYPRAEAQARQRATLALTIIGDLEGARLHAEAGLGPAQRLRDVFWWSSAFWSNQFVCRLSGDWDRSREYCDQGLEIHPTDVRILADRVLLEYELGNFSQGDAYLKRLQDIHRRDSPRPTTAYGIPAVVIPLVARIDSGVELLNIVQVTSQALLSEMSASPLVATMVRVGLALLAVSQGDEAVALEQYAALEPQRGTMVQTGAVSIDRVLGLLAQTIGKPDEAREHLEGALALCRRAGYRSELAWACYDYASLLLQRNDSSKLGRAKSLLEEAQSLVQELGMLPLMGLVAALKEEAELRPARRPAYPGGLTRREVEVLGLIAQGKSNPEISKELFISLNTVTRHLTNIFAKINVSNRAEAAVYAAKRGLL